MRPYHLWRVLDLVTLGPLRRRRRLDRLNDRTFLAEFGDHRVATPARRRPRRIRSRRPQPAAAWILMLAVVAGGVALGIASAHDHRVVPVAEFNRPRHPRPLDWPPLASDQAASRLRDAVASPAGSGGYTFERTVAGTNEPVRWDPCEPIHFVINPAGGPAAGTRIIRSAIREVSALTGLTFHDDGLTAEGLGPGGPKDRPDVERALYGDRWAPVLISWGTSATQHDLDGDVAGEAGPITVSYQGGSPVDVSGSVLLDGGQVTLTGSREQLAMGRAIVLHELGHLVGLGHVDDPTQIMNPSTTEGTTDYGAGDRRGLAILGAGECRPDV